MFSFVQHESISALIVFFHIRSVQYYNYDLFFPCLTCLHNFLSYLFSSQANKKRKCTSFLCSILASLEDIDTKRTKKIMKKREHMTLGLIMMSILNTLRALPLVGFFLYFNLAELVTPRCKRWSHLHAVKIKKKEKKRKEKRKREGKKNQWMDLNIFTNESFRSIMIWGSWSFYKNSFSVLLIVFFYIRSLQYYC